jgi:catalase
VPETTLVTSSPIVDGIVDEFALKMRARKERDKLPFMLRGAHPHHHGIVRARFHVEQGLRQDVAHGIFAQPGGYPAYVRFSNSGADPDVAADARGMAIKVMGVKGEKLIDDEKQTQDFLLVNFPIFIAKDPAEFHALLVASRELKEASVKNPGSLPALLTAFNQRFPLVQKAKSVIGNPLRVSYFSQSAYTLGVANAVKYCARPRIVETTAPSQEELKTLGPEYLRAAMKDTLGKEEVLFDFMVQPRTGDEMSVDDPTNDWDEKKAPFVKVATIVIPAQSFDSDRQLSFAEDISYNPWHSLQAHRPLGAINEARRDAYLTLRDLRNAGKPVHLPEPTGNETFK